MTIIYGNAVLDNRKEYTNKIEINIKRRCCCPICGHHFDEDEIKEEGNICPTYHTNWGQSFSADELITDDDDYLWCQ